jgi:hypothetical protein
MARASLIAPPIDHREGRKFAGTHLVVGAHRHSPEFGEDIVEGLSLLDSN